LNSAFSIPGVVENDTIKCLCEQCRNYFRYKRYTIEMATDCFLREANIYRNHMCMLADNLVTHLI
jgi:hypothetical protein